MSGTRMVTYAIGAVIAGALFLLLMVRVASDPQVKANLGSDVFVVGRADRLAQEIRARGPLLFQDPSGRGRNIVVDHSGTDAEKGWRATLQGTPSEFPTRVEDGKVVVDIRAGASATTSTTAAASTTQPAKSSRS